MAFRRICKISQTQHLTISRSPLFNHSKALIFGDKIPPLIAISYIKFEITTILYC